MRHLLLITAALVTCMEVNAEGLSLEPGLWEITTTRSSFKGGKGPITETEQQCIKEGDYDPTSFMTDLPEDCSPLDQKVDGNKMTFKISCNIEGFEQQIDGKFTSEGDTMTGDVTIKVDAMGQKMEMTANSKGKRIGDCPK